MASRIARPVRTGGIALALALLAIPLSPRPAHACLWNIFELFAPLPPCTVADKPVKYRVGQADNRILVKLAVIAAHIKEVEAEIAGWNNAIGAAKMYENRLVQIYGDLSATPMPSLSFTYQPLGVTSYVRRRPDGTYAVGITPIDLRGVVDSVWGTFHTAANLTRLYALAWARVPSDLSRNVFGPGQLLDAQITALGDYRSSTRPSMDSLTLMGGRIADRYAGRADVAGLSEARISDLAISLSKLRGTVFEANASAIASSLEALGSTAATQRVVDQDRAAATSELAF